MRAKLVDPENDMVEAAIAMIAKDMPPNIA